MTQLTSNRPISKFEIIAIGLSLVGVSLYRRFIIQRRMASPDFLRHAEALNRFFRSDSSARTFSEELRTILEIIAITGNYWYDWRHLKSVLHFRLSQVLDEYNKQSSNSAEIGPPKPLKTGETFEELKSRISSALDVFDRRAPYTLQRFCELLLYPNEVYSSIDNFALALDKVLLVTSTYPPTRSPYPSLPLPRERLQALALPARGRRIREPADQVGNGVLSSSSPPLPAAAPQAEDSLQDASLSVGGDGEAEAAAEDHVMVEKPPTPPRVQIMLAAADGLVSGGVQD